MGQYHTGIFLYRWFGIGCAAGCLLMNWSLDVGYTDAARAARFVMGAVHFAGQIFCRFPAAAAGIVFMAVIGLLYLRRTHRARLWMMLIVLAAGVVYAGVASVFVRGMMEGYLSAG